MTFRDSFSEILLTFISSTSLSLYIHILRILQHAKYVIVEVMCDEIESGEDVEVSERIMAFPRPLLDALSLILRC